MMVEHDFADGERELREPEPRLGRQVDILVARVGDDDDHDPLEAELSLGGVRERDMPVVRRVERPAKEADHSHTSVSSPISTSVPVRAPAALSAASSSSGGGGVPVTRRPRSVRKMR